jgi:hypothetical protein
MEIVSFKLKNVGFCVYFKALNSKPIIVKAQCHQLFYGSTIMFFDMPAKEVAKFRAQYGQPPECVASFNESDITAIIKVNAIKGKIPNNALIKREMDLAELRGDSADNSVNFPEGFVEVLNGD